MRYTVSLPPIIGGSIKTSMEVVGNVFTPHFLRKIFQRNPKYNICFRFRLYQIRTGWREPFEAHEHVYKYGRIFRHEEIRIFIKPLTHTNN